MTARKTIAWSFPGGSEVKVSACNVGDLGSIPGLGRSPGEGNGNPLQYSCLENPMDRGAWWAIVHGVAKSWTRLSDFTFTLTIQSFVGKEMSLLFNTLWFHKPLFILNSGLFLIAVSGSYNSWYKHILPFQSYYFLKIYVHLF